MKPTVGRIVHYKLSEADISEINRRRALYEFKGNPVSAGEVVPVIVAIVWPDEFGAGIPGINGQALLDGEDSLWICSRREGPNSGEWMWPERV